MCVCVCVCVRPLFHSPSASPAASRLWRRHRAFLSEDRAPPSSAAPNPVILKQIDDLKQQNANLQLLALIAIILAVFSILCSLVLGFFVFFRRDASNVPCVDPHPHVPLKEFESLQQPPPGNNGSADNQA